MKMNDEVRYIDIKGVEHNALVSGFDARTEGVIDLIYVEANGYVMTKYAVPHVSHESRKENNADLPSYPLNAYKMPDEEHKAIPSDHPIHDHPFAAKEKDDDGNVIEKPRPMYEADVQAHQVGPDVATMLDEAPPASE